ncbi:hypothetical protein MLD38_025225 [Melastoma candidum]|uniref:Uncharacterized protein n=1 Tax=Melastoma candidum TaxID=119954 RepID=A0ACB9NW30_9MYRT|nr:hypothetical protein MLD38_025225 [Melastoma candidum]
MEGSYALARVVAGDPAIGGSSSGDPVGSVSLPGGKPDAQPTTGRPISGVLPSGVVAPWEGFTGFPSIPNQSLDKLLEPANVHSINFDGGKGDHFADGDDIAVGLSVSHCGEQPETCLSFTRIKRLRVDQDGGSGGLPRGSESDQANETGFPRTWDRTVNDASFLMRDYEEEEQIHVGTVDSSYDHEAVNVISVAGPYKGEVGVLSFGIYNGEDGSAIPVGRPLCNLDESYVQLPQIKQIDGENSLDPVPMTRMIKPRSNTGSKNKPESKHLKKESLNHFPSSVRNLICTGILDGVPVKYVSSSREELRGVVKGSGYLCGCQTCDFTKVLSAFEFEKHAGCKTKHPNNHIFFENGKTIYQVVQELRSTPEDMLFDTVQSVFGAPINEKSFRVWKESYLAATRELRRIYGKEMNT